MGPPGINLHLSSSNHNLTAVVGRSFTLSMFHKEFSLLKTKFE